MIFLIQVLLTIIDAYFYIVIASVILSWLLAFGILPMTNKFVYRIAMTIRNLTEPVFEAIRAVVPTIFGLDFSPIIVLLALQGIRIGIIQTAIAILN